MDEKRMGRGRRATGKNVEGSLDREATRMDERRCSRGRGKQ